MSDDEYQVALVESRVSAWDKASGDPDEENTARAKFVPVKMADERVRYSVREALLLTALAAVALGGLQWVRPDYFAGILGVVAFLWLVALSILKPKAAILQVGWWVLLLVYLIVSVVAAVG